MAKSLPSRADIMKCLAQTKRGMDLRELAAHLDVSEAAVPRFSELLEQLGFEGSVRRLAGSRYKAGEARGEGYEGVLSVNPRGFGFVAAAGQDDAYIPAEAIGGALHGDRVRVVVVSKSPRGAEGRIQAIVQRRNPRVAGVLRRRKKSAWLEPDDSRVRGPIVVVEGAARGKDGDAAVVSITRFPEYANENAEGEVCAVLGAPGDPNTEVAKILVREQIDEEHPAPAIQEAERMAARLKQLPVTGRVDLRQVPLPTIDPEDARDHDDAVWVERTPGGYRAWVAIADVSEYVQPGSELDNEALARGCTIYLPDRAIPMLPAALAADLCSLLPDHDRLCLCVIADLDKRGSVSSFEVVEGVMRSAAMLTYGGVARALGFSDAPPKSAGAEHYKKDLKVLDELAGKLRRARFKRGALDLDLPEPKVELDPETGAPTTVRRRAQDPGVKRAYAMIEELMLLANELVAEWLSKRRSPAIYRVHAKPDETKLQRLGEVAELLGVDFVFEEMSEPTEVKKWLEKIAGHEKQQVLEMLMLRSLKQAVYDIVNIGHFGLASDNYLHFTSPIRRYPDILVHRAVKRLLRGEKPDISSQAIEALRLGATRASVRERAAVEVEREVVDLYRALYARELIGKEYEGTIVSVVSSGLYVSLDDPFIDVLVRFESLGPDHYEVSEHELGVEGARSGERLMIGDRLRVVIEDAAVLRRAVYARRAQVAVRAFGTKRGERPRRADDSKPGRSRKHEERRPKHERRAPSERGAGPGKGRGKPTRAKDTKVRKARAPSTRGQRRR